MGPKLLLAIHNAYTDNTSGAARSMRTIVEWLAASGFQCEVICTARFDAKPPESIAAHLESLEITPARETLPRRLSKSGAAPLPALSFELAGVPVTMLLTRHNRAESIDRGEFEQMSNLIKHRLKNAPPDLLLTYGSHGVVLEFMRQASQRGIPTIFSLRNYGYEDPGWFTWASQILTCSPYLSGYYRETTGIESEGIVSPINWQDVLSNEESRSFVTFVNPSLAKGAALFARLADMLGSRRPDIPILVVQSAADAASLNSIPGIDFSQYPQIMAAPPVPRPREFFELTRIMLVPSVFAEPFGRVAAEALINGVPPIVSDRGSLPETVGDAGVVLPIPEWINPDNIKVPDENEVKPWFDAVCDIWDNDERYKALSEKGRQEAERLYSEDALKARYLAFFQRVLSEGPSVASR